jgi:hypothetical protein
MIEGDMGNGNHVVQNSENVHIERSFTNVEF